MATVEEALKALEPLRDAGSGKGLLELGWIREVRVQGARALFLLALPGFALSQRDRIAAEARQALLAVSGIDDVQIELAQPAPAPAEPAPAPAPPATAYYENCDAVRAAGAAPLYDGQPGYSRKLDRDGDGVACE
jgi:metal-sulfur cluster biosynthetic enzyme